DREEAVIALAAARATLRRASELGARFVVLQLGEVVGLERDWIFARDKYLRGALDVQLSLRLKKARDAAKERSLDSARRALDVLASEANDVTLLIRCPRRYTELPSPLELDQLLREFSGAPLAPLLDLSSAHLLDDMGFHPLELTLGAFL